jgi:hypothetical protein
MSKWEWVGAGSIQYYPGTPKCYVLHSIRSSRCLILTRGHPRKRLGGHKAWTSHGLANDYGSACRGCARCCSDDHVGSKVPSLPTQ